MLFTFENLVFQYNPDNGVNSASIRMNGIVVEWTVNSDGTFNEYRDNSMNKRVVTVCEINNALIEGLDDGRPQCGMC